LLGGVASNDGISVFSIVTWGVSLDWLDGVVVDGNGVPHIAASSVGLFITPFKVMLTLPSSAHNNNVTNPPKDMEKTKGTKNKEHIP
jgi:hypothetical protein